MSVALPHHHQGLRDTVMAPECYPLWMKRFLEGSPVPVLMQLPLH